MEVPRKGQAMSLGKLLLVLGLGLLIEMYGHAEAAVDCLRDFRKV